MQECECMVRQRSKDYGSKMEKPECARKDEKRKKNRNFDAREWLSTPL